jgi:hypothetical protein
MEKAVVSIMPDNIQVWQAKEPNLAKLYLQEYRPILKRCNGYCDALDELHDLAKRATSRISATRLSGTSSHGGMEDNILKAVDTEDKLQSIIGHLKEALLVREALIEQLSDERYKTILTFRYINGEAWPSIQRKVRYEERQMYELHGRALEEVSRLMKVRSKTQ